MHTSMICERGLYCFRNQDYLPKNDKLRCFSSLFLWSKMFYSRTKHSKQTGNIEHIEMLAVDIRTQDCTTALFYVNS